MNKITILILSTFLFCGSIFSQCISNSEYDSYTTINNGFIESISTFVSPDDYITVSNILENDYIFSASHSGSVNDYIVLTDVSNNIIEQGVSPISYSFAPGDISGGLIRLHFFLDASCNVDDINLNVTMHNATVEPNTCQLPENPKVRFRRRHFRAGENTIREW